MAFPEGEGTTDEVFPEAGLGFVDAEGDAAAEGSGFVGGVDAHFIEGVAHFVEGAEECAGHPVFFEAGGDADVVLGEVGAEGVDGAVETAAGEIVAEFLKDGAGELFLGGLVEIAGEGFVGDAVFVLDDFGDEGDEVLFEGFEEGVEGGDGHAFFVVIEEDVVGDAAGGDADCGGVLAFEFEDAIEPGSEGGVVIFSAGLGPDAVGQGADFGGFHDEGGGDFSGFIEVAAGDADEGAFVGVTRGGGGFGFGGGEEG